MPKGFSLHIGLNFVDPKHYQGWDGELAACEADAEDMTAIAKANGFEPQVLINKKATRKAVKDALTKLSKTMAEGDLLLLSYSGHGGQLPDKNGDEKDDMDETWCLWDGEMSDDELHQLYGKFKAGVRILIFSDSCHSGTVSRDLLQQAAALKPDTRVYRAMPEAVALRTYRANKVFYDEISAEVSKEKEKPIAASVILISGCQDNQLSQDGVFNGLFTGQMLKTWREGTFKGDYKKFHKTIIRTMPPDQSPAFTMVGTQNGAFMKQKPFTI
jgi:metacaspase-1